MIKCHYAGDVVVYEGSTYQAVNDTGKPPTFANDWTLLAELIASTAHRTLRKAGFPRCESGKVL